MVVYTLNYWFNSSLRVFLGLGYKMVCGFEMLLFFFFKQKTAYEIRLSLVGSEMCIRDRV